MENTKETSGKTEKTVVIIEPSNLHIVQESCNCLLELAPYLGRDELSILKEIQEETKSAIQRNFYSEIRFFQRWIYHLRKEELLDFYTTLSGEIEIKEKELEAKKKDEAERKVDDEAERKVDDEAEMLDVPGSLPDLIRKLFRR